MLFNTCDSYFRELHEEGIGSDSKSTEPVTRDDEETLYVVNGNILALHGVNEHYCIKISQIVSNISPEGKVRYKYTENCSKNRAGGFN